MKTKDLLIKQMDREEKYCNDHEVGSEEYEKSFRRLSELRKEYLEIEKSESEAERRQQQMNDDKKDRKTKNALEAVKIIGGGIIMPAIGYVVVTAFEKDESFTSALKGVVNCFIPKKMN